MSRPEHVMTVFCWGTAETACAYKDSPPFQKAGLLLCPQGQRQGSKLCQASAWGQRALSVQPLVRSTEEAACCAFKALMKVMKLQRGARKVVTPSLQPSEGVIRYLSAGRGQTDSC